MIDDLLIRQTLEGVLGSAFLGLPVTRINESAAMNGPHIRTYLVREGRSELYHGIRRAKGMFGILVHLPFGDGVDAAEGISKQIPALYRSNEVENATITASDGTVITIREISVMSAYGGVDEGKSDMPWIIAPVQIDWRVDITA